MAVVVEVVLAFSQAFAAFGDTSHFSGYGLLAVVMAAVVEFGRNHVVERRCDFVNPDTADDGEVEKVFGVVLVDSAYAGHD